MAKVEATRRNSLQWELWDRGYEMAANGHTRSEAEELGDECLAGFDQFFIDACRC